MKTIKIFLTVFPLATLLSCGKKQEAIINTSETVIVSTAAAKASPVLMDAVAGGYLAASKTSNLSTRMMGTVTQISVSLGDEVKKGAVLMTLYNRDIDASVSAAQSGVNAAKAAFNLAQNDLEAYKTLFVKNSVSAREYEGMKTAFVAAQTSYDQARAHLEMAKAQQAFTQITAPYDGQVTNRFINQGDMAQPGMPLLEIEGGNGFEIWTSVGSEYIADYEIGDEVSVKIHPSELMVKGVISELGMSSKNTAGQYRVKIALEAKNKFLLSGMYTSIYFNASKTNKQTIYIPMQAVVTKGQLKGVYVISEQQTAMLRWLRLGQENRENVEVLSGLVAGETYVLKAASKMYNGIAIEVQN
jgi:RND family efflux transporter MFP subunit